MKNINHVNSFLIIMATLLINTSSDIIELRDLKSVLNRTLCPIVVHANIDENRYPKLIKEYKCGEKGACAAGEPACCGARAPSYSQRCVEVIDSTQVYYYQTDEMLNLDIAVGCVCYFLEDYSDEPEPGKRR